MRVFTEELRRGIGSWRFAAALIIGATIASLHAALFVVPESQNQEMYIELIQHPMTAYGRWMGGWAETMFPFLYFYLQPLLCCLPFSDSLWSDRKSGWAQQIAVRSSRRTYLLAKMAACSISATLVALIPLLLNFYLAALFLPVFQPEPSSALYPIHAYSMWSDLFYANAPLYLASYALLIAITVSLLACLPIAITSWVRNGFILACSSFLLCTILQFLFAGDLMGTEDYVFLSPVTFMQPYQPFHSGIGLEHIAITLTILLIVEVFGFWHQLQSKDMIGGEE